MVFAWKVPIYSVSAQAAGEELERIKAERGSLTPEDIVDESRDSKAVLHGCFEWDDHKAAEQYRCSQASKILRTIVTTVEPQAGAEPVKVRAFVPIEGNYESIHKVVRAADMYETLLEDARKELDAFRQKYQSIKALSGVLSAIDTFLVA